MAMQFYASPEQIMRDRSEYARKGIARGRSVVVLTYAGGVLFVAENAAKVVYNASSPPDPFDYDCGYWLVGCLRHLVDTLGAPEFVVREQPAVRGQPIADPRVVSAGRPDIDAVLRRGYGHWLGSGRLHRA